MSPPINHRSLAMRRAAAFVLIVLLSLGLPLAVVGWSVYYAMSGKPLGHPTGRETTYNGPLHPGAFNDHQLWFTARRYVNRAYAAPVAAQIQQMDIQTGETRNVGTEATNLYYIPLLLNKELYAFGQAIFLKVDGDFRKVADLPERHTSFFSSFFSYEGHLTTVMETKQGQFRLQHLIDGQWVEGPTIRLPPRGSQWRDDPQTGIQLRPPKRSQQTASSRNQYWLIAIEFRGQIHLFVRELNGHFSAYRQGFDFVADKHDVASASSPENLTPTPSDHNANGWEPIRPIKNLVDSGDDTPPNGSPQYDPNFLLGRDDQIWAEMRCDHDGPIVISDVAMGRMVRRNRSGHWIDLEGFNEPSEEAYFSRTILVDQADGVAYLLDQNFQWNSAALHRIEGNVVGPPQILSQGVFAAYLARWRQIFAGVCFAWLLHLGLLVSGTTWLLRGRQSGDYAFGQQQVQLASPTRRALAKAIDLLLLAGSITLLAKLQITLFRIELPPVSEEIISNHLFAYENALFWGTRNGWPEFQQQFQNAVLSSIEAIHSFIVLRRTSLTTAALELLVLLGFMVVIEGRFGFTPGKWLLRIQTLRSTLRPCAFTHALLRTVIDWFDAPFLLTPIPALLSMTMSASRQRLGDRLADTLVVNVDSNQSTMPGRAIPEQNLSPAAQPSGITTNERSHFTGRSASSPEFDNPRLWVLSLQCRLRRLSGRNQDSRSPHPR
ncbi:RDD family protein [Schlesneria paludicola]|uniref:RDD family protein n=1 Tax=Schlesneria paludicola TaxID=360056 RepID=UPI0012FA2C40|nr:RDD family protein [Schlesneria paludicola]